MHQEIEKSIGQIEKISEYSLSHKNRIKYLPDEKQKSAKHEKF